MAPTLTILVPTHDRADVLTSVWPSWLEQEGLTEIVIVDDGSAQDYNPVFDAIASACAARGITFKPFRNKQRLGAPSAKNLGLQECTAEEILTTDDDILLPPEMVSLCRAGRPRINAPVIIGPRVIYLKNGESKEAALARAKADTSSYFNYKTLTITPWIDTGAVQQVPFVSAVALWPASLFRGGLQYHEGYGGNGYREETDPQLNAGLKFNAKVYLVPNAVCFHLAPAIAYVRKSGQRRGGMLWFEWWTMMNNAVFIHRFKGQLRSDLKINPLKSWFHLLGSRLSPNRLLHFMQQKFAR